MRENCAQNEIKSIGEWEEEWSIIFETKTVTSLAAKAEGQSFYNKQDYRNALERFKIALKLNKCPLNATNLGWVYWGLKNNQKAQKYFKYAIKLDNQYHYAYYALGFSQVRIGKLEEGIESYNKALEIKNNSDAQAGLAEIFSIIRDFPRAIEQYQLVANSRVNRILGYYGLAYIHSELLNYQKAIDFLDEMPKGADTFNRLGVIYKKANRKEEAMKEFGKVLEIDKFHESAHCHLAHFSILQKDYQKAEEEIVKGISKGKTENGHFYHALLVYKLGDYPRAVEMFQLCLNLFPFLENVYKVHYYLALSLFKIDPVQNENQIMIRLNKSIQMHKDWSKSFYRRGLIYQSKGLIDQSLQNFISAVASNSKVHFIDRLSDKKIEFLQFQILSLQTKDLPN